MLHHDLCVQIGPHEHVALNEQGNLICLEHFRLNTDQNELFFKYVKEDNPYSLPPDSLNHNDAYPLRIYARQQAIKESLFSTFKGRPFGCLQTVHIEWDMNPNEKRQLRFVFAQQPHPDLLEGLVALGAEVEVLGEA